MQIDSYFGGIRQVVGGEARGERRVAVTVREIIVPPPVRFAQAVASAALVRDVAAFGALVVFGTMLAVILGSGGSV